MTKRKLIDAGNPGTLIGQQTADGIFIGRYVPKDREGNSLGKIFNVFAAPQDLGGTVKYADAVKNIAQLKNWHGFDGTDYATDTDLYKALKEGSYNGGWIIPTRDLLTGKDVDGRARQTGNLLAARDIGALKDTFNTSPARSATYFDWYWSCTEIRNTPNVIVLHLTNGYESWDGKNGSRASLRPVRLVDALSPSRS